MDKGAQPAKQELRKTLDDKRLFLGYFMADLTHGSKMTR